jgi:Flp pilus assembly pilin Flp
LPNIAVVIIAAVQLTGTNLNITFNGVANAVR